MTSREKARIVFLLTPGIGHLVSTVEVARRLLQRELRLSASILTMNHPVPPWAPAISAYVDSVRASSSGLDISFEELPPADDPPNREGMRGESFLSLLVESNKPLVRAAVARLVAASPVPVAAVVMDLFSTTMVDVADELGIPSYIFFTSTAAMVGLMLHLPTLDAAYPVDMADVEGEIEFPGFRHTVPPHFMPSFMTDKKNEAYKWVVHHGRQFPRAKGIIANTFAALEPGPLRALADGIYLADCPTPPIYPVGPVLSLEKKPESGPSGCDCLSWLAGQPPSSVVFICFGSMGCFSAEQTREIAVGLERSGHPFLWVLRSPSNTRLRTPTDADLAKVLPEGFLERNKVRGLVWPTWAPQVEVLGHPATGGFVTHCGWNSCLESLWFGVPMVTWPLHAEQHLNTFEMAQEAGVVAGVIGASGGLVSAEEVERGVRVLMGDGEEGRRARKRAGEMKVASRRAVEAEGSSFVSLGRLASELVTGGLGRPVPPDSLVRVGVKRDTGAVLK